MAEIQADVHMQLSCSDQDMDTLKAKQSANLKLANCHSKKSMYQDHGEPTSSTVETAAKDKLESNNQSLMHVGTGSSTHAEPRKELNESVRHGTSIFPFAAYVWDPQPCASRVPLHWHKELELVRFSNGEYEISVDMHNVVVKSDAFLLLPGNIMHTFTLPANCQESAIVFDPNMLSFSAYDEVQSEIFEPLMSSNIPLPPIVTTDHPAFNRIDKLYRYCVRHGGTSNASERLLIKAKILEILAIYHEYGLISRKEMHGQKVKSKQDKLKELLNYVDAHYAGPITIRDASLRLGVTDQYFCRYFRRVTGMSFTEYLNDLRLRRATKEIELTNRPISDIAFDHGFENAGYFFKNFKLKYGITPLRYRKKFLQENGRNSKAHNNYGAAFSPVDANHTSAMHDRDINTIMNVPASDDSNHEHFVSQGLIAADVFMSDKEDGTHARGSMHSTADAAPSATDPSLNALSHQAAIDEQASLADDPSLPSLVKESGTHELKSHDAHQYSANNSHAMNFGGDSAQHFDEEAFYDDEYEDEELSANELSAAAQPRQAASSSSTMPLSSKAVPNRAEEIAAQLRCQDPKTGKSCFAVATTDSDIKALLRTRQIKHLEASESEDELFDDDEHEEIVNPNKASDNNATDAIPNKSRMELINSGLHELTQNNGRSVLSAASKPRQSRFIKNTQEPDTTPKKQNFVSALEEFQSGKLLRAAAKSKSSDKSDAQSNAKQLKEQTKSLINSQLDAPVVAKPAAAESITTEAKLRDNSSLEVEGEDPPSSSEILRRAHEQKLKTDAQYAAKQQQKQLKPANRAELRAKIAELEERRKNQDPFSI
ncbi:AraC family transcriptional regulator [uncultured Anaerobiospirillum sp.]|uniref:AraC family transcriptional regulator n=1 Tax=uncultured Anaerobiospirillum sp. TaxID=265728 RepID=UPI0028042F68|nr:AraC family transcriptional regulator [uncultured Anaerobiospirillum sp.]